MADYVTDNIIIGNGEVPAIRDRQGLGWVLPGGVITRCRDCAIHHAEKLNTAISDNLQPFKRRILRGA